VSDEAQIHDLDAQQLREVVRTLIAEAAAKDREIAFKQAFIDKLTHEMAVLKRLKFAAQSEAYNAEQKSLLEETIDTDLRPGRRDRAGSAAATGPGRQTKAQAPAVAPQPAAPRDPARA
jgi:transposase